MQYKAIIFDFFGVISSEVAPFWFGKYFSKDQIAELKEKYVYPADIGEITGEELFSNLAKIVSKNREAVEKEWLELVHINQDLIEIIRSLKSKYTIALCSNAPSQFLRAIIESNSFSSLFDIIVISSEIKATKPSSIIFEYVLNKLKLASSEVIFIDDNPNYVSGANSIGINALLYTANPDLTKAFKKIGVL